MIRFSASDVAMTGFGVVRQRPKVLLWWVLLHLVFISVSSTLLLTLAGPALTQMMALQASHPGDDPAAQAAFLRLFQQLAPVYLLLVPVTLAFYALLFAAMSRAVLRPGDNAFGYLRLGADEWRQFLLFLWASVVGIGLELALIVVGTVLVIVVAAAYAAMNRNAATGAGGGAAMAALALVGLFVAAYVYVMVRFSLASAMTFDTGKVSLLKSWRLTKGRFWPMFGAYLIAGILALVVGLLGLIVMYVVALLVGGVDGLSFIFRPDMSSLAAYFTPARLVYLALSGVVYALVWPVLLTPPAAIYRAITAAAEPTPAAWPSPPSSSLEPWGRAPPPASSAPGSSTLSPEPPPTPGPAAAAPDGPAPP